MRVYYLEGKYDKALKEAKVLASKGFPQGCYYLALLGYQGKAEVPVPEQIKCFKKAYEAGYLKAAVYLGDLYLKGGNKEEALNWYLKALDGGIVPSNLISLLKSSPQLISKLKELSRKNFKAAKLLGKYYYSVGDYGKALKYYRLALSLAPNEALRKELSLRVARTLLKLGKKSEALKLLTRLYEEGYAQAAYYIGRYYESEASQIHSPTCGFLKAKSLKEFLSYKLSVELKRKRLYRLALEWYERAPSSPEVEYRILRIKWRLKGNRCGDLRLIKKFAKEGVLEAKRDFQRLYLSGICSLRKLTFKKRGESRVKPETPAQIYYQKAKELLSYNRQKAIFFLKKACQYGSVGAELDLAYLLFKEKPELSFAVLYYYAKSGVPRAMFLLGKLYLNSGQTKKGEFWLKEAANSGYIPAIRFLARYYLDNGMIREAVSLLESADRKGYCFAAITLGQIYMGFYTDELIDLKRALSYFEKAASRDCLDAFYNLARFYYYKREYRKSLRFAEQYLLRGGDEVKGHEIKFRDFRALGLTKEAAEELKTLISLGYKPTPGQISEFWDFLGIKEFKTLYLQPSTRGNFLLAAARKNFYASHRRYRLGFCLAYKAVEYKGKGAPLYFVRLSHTLLRTYPVKFSSFLQQVKRKPSVCDRIVKSYLKELEIR